MCSARAVPKSTHSPTASPRNCPIKARRWKACYKHFEKNAIGMNRKFIVYLDTSALFAGIWSSSGDARLILKLGEAGVIQILVGSQVLSEIEGVIRTKTPELLGFLALILERSRITTGDAPDQKLYEMCHELVRHQGDATIIASAWSNKVDYFVTLDRKHFLNNPSLRDALSFPIGTPGDFLNWLRSNLNSY